MLAARAAAYGGSTGISGAPCRAAVLSITPPPLAQSVKKARAAGPGPAGTQASAQKLTSSGQAA